MDKQASFWFFAGLGCGTVVGMLYAPLPGTRSRAIAVSKAKQARGLFARPEEGSGGNVNPAGPGATPGARQASERINRALDASRPGERR